MPSPLHPLFFAGSVLIFLALLLSPYMLEDLESLYSFCIIVVDLISSRSLIPLFPFYIMRKYEVETIVAEGEKPVNSTYLKNFLVSNLIAL